MAEGEIRKSQQDDPEAEDFEDLPDTERFYFPDDLAGITITLFDGTVVTLDEEGNLVLDMTYADPKPDGGEKA